MNDSDDRCTEEHDGHCCIWPAGHVQREPRHIAFLDKDDAGRLRIMHWVDPSPVGAWLGGLIQQSYDEIVEKNR